jgi:hypothetical protein
MRGRREGKKLERKKRGKKIGEELKTRKEYCRKKRGSVCTV